MNLIPNNLFRSLVDFFYSAPEIVKKDDASFRVSIVQKEYEKLSIIRKAKSGVLQFPLIVSSAVSLDDLVMVSKALERNYCTFVRIAMGLNDKISTNQTKVDYIKKFHTSDFSDKAPSVVSPVNLLTTQENTDPIRRLNINLLDTKEDSYNLGILNFKNRKSINLNEWKEEKEDRSLPDVIIKRTTDDSRMGRLYEKDLLDNDVKKANELIPSTIRINLFDTESKQETALLIGAKVVSHLVPSEDFVENIITSTLKQRKLFNFIRWTTGELRTFSDMVLASNEMKKEALRQKNNKGWIWDRLKSLKFKSEMQGATIFSKLVNYASTIKNLNADSIRTISNYFTRNDTVIRNVSLLISMDEAEGIKNKYNINVMDGKVAANILKELFAIALVIVDPASEICHMYFDSDTDFSSYPYSTLEREAKAADSNSKKDVRAIVNVLEKMR